MNTNFLFLSRNRVTLVNRRHKTISAYSENMFASLRAASVLSGMIAKASIKLCVISALGILLICFSGAQGRTKVQNRAAIRKAKTLRVSDIETGMPHVILEKWLRGLVWEKPRIKWKAVDCGYEIGGSLVRLPSLPICVELSAGSFDMFVGITLQMSELKNGIRESDPSIRRITISREDQGLFEADKLSALATKLNAVMAM